MSTSAQARAYRERARFDEMVERAALAEHGAGGCYCGWDPSRPDDEPDTAAEDHRYFARVMLQAALHEPEETP